MPKVKNSLDCTENYMLNGCAVLPGDKIMKKVQTDNGLQVADSDVQKEKKNNRVSNKNQSKNI